MIRAVVRKELRDQRPFAVLALVIVALDTLSEFVATAPDKRPIADTWQSLSGGDGLDAILLILAFALGAGLLVRELDERTIELLDALPVQRWQLFTVKVGVALGALMLVPVGEVLETVLLQALSRTSLDRGFHLPLLGAWLALVFAQMFVVLSVSLALSFLRRLGWLIAGVLFCLMLALRDRHPLWRLIDPNQLVEPHFHGSHWALPDRALMFQLPIGLAAFGLALLLFSGAADRAFSRTAKTLDRAWLKGLLAVGVFCTVIWGCYLAFGHQKPEDREPPKSRPFTFAASTLGHAQTQHYAFSFHANEQRLAEPLASQADAVFKTVATFLEVEKVPTIAVDLTGAPQHMLGVTHSAAVRMALDRSTAAERVATLAHETTHALAREIASAGDQRRTLEEMRAFSEGLASYVEHRFFMPARTEDARFWVAALSARDELHFEKMIDGTAFLDAHDDTIVYPVGEMLVDAVVKRYGESGPRRLLDALGRKDPPKELHGLKLWLDTFQAAGMDLGLVVNDLSRSAASFARERREVLEQLARPRAYLERGKSGSLEVHLVLDRPLPNGWDVVCRFRPDESARIDEFEDGDEEAGTFAVPSEMIVAGRVWVQVGVYQQRADHALYEPWVQLAVP